MKEANQRIQPNPRKARVADARRWGKQMSLLLNLLLAGALGHSFIYASPPGPGATAPDVIRSLEGEWLVTLDAASDNPSTCRWVVENDVLGCCTVMGRIRDFKGSKRPGRVQVCFFPAEAPEAVLLKSAGEQGMEVGRYNQTNLCVEWKHSGDKWRWRFNKTFEHFTSEAWDECSNDWIPSGTGVVYSRPSATNDLKAVIGAIVVGGYRDDQGTLLQTYAPSDNDFLDSTNRFAVDHVPTAYFLPSGQWQLRARPSNRTVHVKEAIARFRNSWIGETNMQMRLCDDGVFEVVLDPASVSDLNVYAIRMQSTDGHVGHSRWFDIRGKRRK